MLMQHVSELRKVAAADGHRALLIVQQAPAGYLQGFATSVDAPYLAAESSADRSDRISELLGREFVILVHETSDQTDAGFLAALAGTLCAAGVLILGLPFSLQDSRPGDTHAQLNSPFNRRLARLLRQTCCRYPLKVRIINPSDEDDARHHPGTDGCSSPASLSWKADWPLRRQSPGARPDNPAAAAEQHALFRKACRHLEQHHRACIVITGRRGRGKSTLLARIAEWLQLKGMSVAMTAARRSALHSVLKHGTQATFYPPCEAIESGCQVLLVDEAASLPVATLMQYLERHQHVIYCTTVEGYEQAGRAFDIRFSENLEQMSRSMLALHPERAWRWTAADPLEEFIDSLLLSSSGAVASEMSATEDSSHVESGTDSSPMYSTDSRRHAGIVRCLDRPTLADDESLLQQVYYLLRDTHYQTSAADLVALLDGPDLQVWVLEEHQKIRAALLLAIEGDIPANLHDAIVARQRRLPHQLLPQLLAQCANQPAPLQTRVARIIRIAVVPDRRRRGLGSRLLQATRAALTRHDPGMAAIGASFAGDPANLAFWQANGFTRFHTGFRPNPRTGTQAVAVLACNSGQLQDCLATAVRIHDDNQQWLADAPDKITDPADDEALLHRFARGQRSLMDSYAALGRLALRHPLPLTAVPGVSRRQHEAALRRAVTDIVQQHLRSSS